MAVINFKKSAVMFDMLIPILGYALNFQETADNYVVTVSDENVGAVLAVVPTAVSLSSPAANVYNVGGEVTTGVVFPAAPPVPAYTLPTPPPVPTPPPAPTTPTVVIVVKNPDEPFNGIDTLDAIRSYQAVSRAVMIGGDLVVTTHPIIIKKKNIGIIQFAINMANNTVQYRNLSHKIEYNEGIHVHPHIREDGACYGNLGGTLTECLKSRDYATACIIILQFLHNANEADAWGCSINSFPEVTNG